MKCKTRILFIIVLTTVIASTAFADIEDELYRVGKRYLKKGKTEQAILKFIRISEYHPDSKYADEALYRVAKFHYEKKDYFNAERYLIQHKEQFPNSPYTLDTANILNNIYSAKLINKAESDIRNGNWKNVYNDILGFNPTDEINAAKLDDIKHNLFNIIVPKADRSYKEEKFENAVELYKMAANLNVQSVDEKIEACQKYIEFTKAQEAKGLVKFRGAWVDEQGKQAILNMENGDRSLANEDWRMALSFYNKALNLNPDLMLEEEIGQCQQGLAFEKEPKEKGLVKYKGSWVTLDEQKANLKTQQQIFERSEAKRCKAIGDYCSIGMGMGRGIEDRENYARFDPKANWGQPKMRKVIRKLPSTFRDMNDTEVVNCCYEGFAKGYKEGYYSDMSLDAYLLGLELGKIKALNNY